MSESHQMKFWQAKELLWNHRLNKYLSKLESIVQWNPQGRTDQLVCTSSTLSPDKEQEALPPNPKITITTNISQSYQAEISYILH